MSKSFARLKLSEKLNIPGLDKFCSSAGVLVARVAGYGGETSF